MEPQLRELAADAWALYQRHRPLQHVVKPAGPILYFGDYVAYLASRRRVVTVGLNPSRLEFPADDPFARFPALAHLPQEELRARDADGYLESMNAYFETYPYASWFASLEPLLEGMGCSFYSGEENRALHTDLFSPLPTDPTWSKLSPAQRRPLESLGLSLWHRLLEVLRPDLILISVARSYLERIRFPAVEEWRTVFVLERDNPYVLRSSSVRIGRSTARLVYGQAAQVPFGTVSHADKREMGEAVAGLAFENKLLA